jgi:hypothetical protein
MLRNRWSISVVALIFIGALVALGAAIRPTAAARPSFQDATSTATETTTSEITSTATLTATEVTETATEATVTDTPTAVVTPTETVIPTATVTPTPGPITRARFWSFAVKFVCGEASASSTDVGEPSLRPGSYATEINVHNPNYRGPVPVFKKAVLLVDNGAPVGRAPATAAPGAFGTPIALDDDDATLEDCTSIWELTHLGTTPPTPMPLTVGYLVLLSPRDLDVVSVTTASSPTVGQTPGAITLDTLVVEGKRVTIPASAFPQGTFPSEEEFAAQ